MEFWHPAYIGVGSNLDDPRTQVLRAFTKLAELPATRVVLTSPIYVSQPFGPVKQADFANAVVGVLTQLEPRALLAGLRALETAQGRPEQRARWGPRVIDLDVLVFGRERRTDPELTLPHPGIVERNFVLYPLADIAPDLDIPGLGRVTELKGRLTSEGLRLLDMPSTNTELRTTARSSA
ncbi:MAG: 2-amino-4-hydroxy-6-hydroxymethyldihydropteridine diphosphokinase [Steroidobacteraceae bacterium]